MRMIFMMIVAHRAYMDDESDDLDDEDCIVRGNMTVAHSLYHHNIWWEYGGWEFDG